jgi:RHS repeat-associated protein
MTKYFYGTQPPNCSQQDHLDRLTEIQGPSDGNNGGQSSITSYCYNDSATSPSVTTSELLNTSGTWKTTVAVMDGMGHTVQTQTTSDTQGTDYVDMSYDGEGRVYTQSNPHRSGSSSSDGTTTFYYDALGRNVATVHPDNTYATNCYNGTASVVSSAISVKCNSQIGLSSGSWVDSADERGNTWQRTSDAFGDLLEAVEPNGSSPTPSMQTLYSYDGLGDLLSVVQHGDNSGDRDRYFAYDSLGHLLATLNPENSGSLNSPQVGYTAPPALSCAGASSPLYSGAWTTCYAYDVNGNLTAKQDNRQITTTYSYDNQNRLTWKHYSDGVTPANGFGYDGYDENNNALSGLSNVNGRLSQSSNEINAASRYSYDVMGRTVNKFECIPGDCSLNIDVQADYDLAGDPVSLTNGSLQQPITFTYGYDSVARLQTLTSSWTPDCNHPRTLFSAPAYGPVGLTSATLASVNSGCPNSTNVTTEARSYDNRTRIASESYSASAMAATAPIGTISIPASDSEQSLVVGRAAGTGWISIGGGEQSVQIQVQCGPYGQTCPQTIYDSGTVTATINGTQYTIGYGQTDTPNTVASNLASNINGSLVSATASNGTVYLTALTTGSSTNYSLSVTSATNIPQYFSSPSFTTSASGSSLTGGSNGTTVYDTGTMTATVNGVQAQANWGQGDTPSNLASKLASSIQSQMGSFLTATANGASVTLQSKSTDYWTVAVTWNDTNTQYFSSPSFTANPSGMNPNSTGGTAYSYSVSYDGVGNTISLSDSVMGNWTYQYDTLNRLLTTGQVSGGPYNADYGCWTYDGFGNRTAEAISATACNSSPSPINWAHYNTSNQITGTGPMPAGNDYDAAGDVTDDGYNQYLYDGAGRICAVKNISTGTLTGYVYDGEGNRVAKGGLSTFSCNLSSNGFSANAQYVIGLGGEQLTEQDGSNHWLHTNVFAGGALLATYGGSGQSSDTYFALTDWQGTKRAQSGVGGCLTGWSSLPYGNNGTSSGPVPVSINGVVQCSFDATEHHYTGKIHDSETGNDDFGARYYLSTAARWFSPDWAAGAEAVPYASYGSPQTLNLYAFVGNNPISKVDPDGHSFYRSVNIDGDRGATDLPMMMGGSDAIGAGTGDTFYDQSGDGFGQQNGTVQQSSQTAQQQSGDQPSDSTLLAQNNTPPPPQGRTNSPAQGQEPNSTVTIPQPDGSTTTRTYGPDGKAVKDVDTHPDHGAGSPHAHDWDWGKKPPRQPGRPLTPEEQKNMKRAAGGVTAGVIIYWVVSEASRILFPPRNLIPVP